MKRIVGVAMALVLGSAAPSMALLGPETSVGIRVGTGFYQSDSVFGTNTDIDNPVVIGITAGMRQGHFGGELSVDRITVDLETDIKEATLTMIPILLTGQYHFVEEDHAPFDPYIGLGIGYYINSAQASSEAKSMSGVSNYKVEADDSVGFQVSAGANMKISSAVAMVIDARYAITNTDLTASGGGLSAADSIDLNGLVVTAGVKYYFPK